MVRNRDDILNRISNASGLKMYEIAEKLGISRCALWQYKTYGIPANRCLELERLCNGKVTRQEMRPNDHHEYWD